MPADDDGDSIVGFYPAVVPLDLYHSAQRTKVHRGRTHEFINIFRGIAFSCRDMQPYRIHRRVERRPDGSRVTTRNLVSATHLDMVAGSDSIRLPYGPFEEGILKGLLELNPLDFAKGDDDHMTRRLSEVAGEIAELDHKIATVNDRIKRTKDIESLLDLLVSITSERRDRMAELTRLQEASSNHHTESVGEIQSLSRLLRESSEEESKNLRIQIRARLASLVEAIFVYVEPLGKTGSHPRWEARSFVFFRDTSMRFFCVDQSGGGHLGEPEMGTHRDEGSCRTDPPIC
jgi:hypothetical protein